jgi:hypothetical protein
LQGYIPARKEAVVELLAFASFALLVVGWLVAPSRSIAAVSHEEEREAA